MTDHEDQVRSALRSATQHIEMPPDAGREAWRQATRRERRDRALTVGAIAAVAAMVAGILVARTTTDQVAPNGPTPSVTSSAASPSIGTPSASFTICATQPTFGYRVGNGPLQPLTKGSAVDVVISARQTLTVAFAGKCASGGLLLRQDPTDSHALPTSRQSIGSDHRLHTADPR